MKITSKCDEKNVKHQILSPLLNERKSDDGEDNSLVKTVTFETIDNTAREYLSKMIEDPQESFLSKGMAKFYLSLDLLVSRNLLNFPKYSRVEDLSKIFEDSIKYMVERFF